MINRVLIHGFRELGEDSFEIFVEWEIVGLDVPGLPDSKGSEWARVPLVKIDGLGGGVYKPEFDPVLDATNGFLFRIAMHYRHCLLRGEPVTFPIDVRSRSSMAWLSDDAP